LRGGFGKMARPVKTWNNSVHAQKDSEKELNFQEQSLTRGFSGGGGAKWGKCSSGRFWRFSIFSKKVLGRGKKKLDRPVKREGFKSFKRVGEGGWLRRDAFLLFERALMAREGE